MTCGYVGAQGAPSPAENPTVPFSRAQSGGCGGGMPYSASAQAVEMTPVSWMMVGALGLIAFVVIKDIVE